MTTFLCDEYPFLSIPSLGVRFSEGSVVVEDEQVAAMLRALGRFAEVGGQADLSADGGEGAEAVVAPKPKRAPGGRRGSSVQRGGGPA